MSCVAFTRDARLWNGIYLDAFVYPTATLTKTPELEMLKLCGGRKLLDELNLAAGLFEALTALEATGPPAPPEGHTQMLRVWARKMLSRIKRGDVEAHALAELQDREPATYAAFARALAPDAPLEAIEVLVDVVGSR